MIQLELPESLKKASDNARLAAEFIFRPISRKYDRQEHDDPVELAEFGKLSAQAQRSQGKDGTDKPKSAPSQLDQPTDNLNGGNLFACVSVEQLCWGDVGLMLARPGNGLGNAAISAVGTPDQKKLWGKRFAAMAITEPQTGSDSKNIATTAVRDGDEWILNGEKIFVTDGKRCDSVVVWATLDKNVGKAAIRSFFVEKDRPGVEVVRLEKKLGIRASDTATIRFDDCRIPVDNLLGGDDKVKTDSSSGSFGGVMQTFDNTRPLVAAMAVGCAQAALDEATAVLSEQKLIGQDDEVKISSWQKSTVQAELDAMQADVDAARLLVLKAAWMADNKQPNSLLASMSKAKAGRVGNKVTLKCVELCGLAGYSEQLLVEKFARDSKILDIFEGTQQIQQLIVARNVLQKSSRDLK